MNAGERAARERVEGVYAAIDRLPPEALSWTVPPPRDLEDRTIRLAALEREADRFGRGPLLDEARTWLREALAQRVSSRGMRSEAGVWGVSDIGRAEDVAGVRLALEDVVAVAATEDLLAPADAAALAGAGRAMLGMEPLPGAALEPEPEPAAWEPSATDWASADAGAEAAGAAGGGGTLPARSKAATLAVAAVVLVAVILGLATGQFAIALLAAAALGVLGWSVYAGPRRP